MNPILKEGIQALCQNDADIERLIAPRYDEVISLLAGYIAEIELYNPAYGLVGTSDTCELIIRHILDSLAPLGIIYRLLVTSTERQSRAGNEAIPQIADAGSGAGLPGIPLAIALPQCNFTLIERMGRRAGFLLSTRAALGLSNVSVEEREVEKAPPGRFSLVVFRAFKTLEQKILKKLFRLCDADGILAAYKGRREKIKEEMARLEKHCGKWEMIPCKTPFLEEERHLVIMERF